MFQFFQDCFSGVRTVGFSSSCCGRDIHLYVSEQDAFLLKQCILRQIERSADDEEVVRRLSQISQELS